MKRCTRQYLQQESSHGNPDLPPSPSRIIPCHSGECEVSMPFKNLTNQQQHYKTQQHFLSILCRAVN